MPRYVDQLQPEDARELLRILCKEDAKLATRIENMAKVLISDIRQDEVTDEVYRVLERLDVNDLYARSGKTHFGYVEPVEAAYRMVEEALEPFAERVRKLRKLALLPEARTVALGLTEGVIRFSRESMTEFSEWAQDDPLEWLGGWLMDWEKECVNEEQECIREIKLLLK